MMEDTWILGQILQYEKRLLQQFHTRLAQCPPGYLQMHRNHGKNQYYHKLPDEKRAIYLNEGHSWLVNELKYKRVLQEAIQRLELNIAAKEQALQKIKPYDYESIENILPKAYKGAELPVKDRGMWRQGNGTSGFTQSENPFHREYLIHQTSFGLITRSKSEAMTAELLHAAGFFIHYEKKLILRDENDERKVRYPDFTLPIPEAQCWYWEVKGRFQEERYRERDTETERLYHLNGIYEPKNLIVTKDGPDGSFHAEAVIRIIEGILKPQMIQKY